MPGGHIFHRDLTWPFAESRRGRRPLGRRDRPSRTCGYAAPGARRGGAVSGIPGHNAARAVLAADGG